ncbi:hypothetical protein TNCV_1137371 [Trichonephila clavipes]|nr:hypothetical protein TNCV_1137371 [Trichonephila clavipes]
MTNAVLSGKEQSSDCLDYGMRHRPTTMRYGLGCHLFLKLYPFDSHFWHTDSKCSRLLWLSRLPDLSAIDPIRNVMRRRLQSFRNVDDLAEKLETIWHEVLQDSMREVYQSVPPWVIACIQAGGDKCLLDFLPL